MKRSRTLMVLLVAFFVLTASIPAAALEVEFTPAAFDGETRDYLAIGAVVAVVVAVALLIRSSVRNNRAGEFYRQGEAYAAQGQWDLAADAFAEAAKINSRYRDVQAKLAYAREQAEKMLVALGDESREKEQFEEAMAYYQKALVYQPASVLARARIEALGGRMVAVHYRRGQAYETQNRWEEALREYEKAYRIDPRYEDLSDRYFRAKARVEGDLPLLGLLFLLNHSDRPGLETPLLQALQNELAALAPGRYALVDYRRVQSIMSEQAEALGERFDDSLAMDIGRLLGADEVLTGEILSVTRQTGRIRVRVAAKILQVPGAGLVKKVELTHTFAGEVEMEDLPQVMPELARELAKKIVD